jgi:hypothetical protein
MENKLFKQENNIFQWKDVKTWLIRSQYNEMLKLVLNEYLGNQYKSTLPNFLNNNYCLTIEKCKDDGKCDSILDNILKDRGTVSPGLSSYLAAKHQFEIANEYVIIAQKSYGFDKSDNNKSALEKANKELKNAEAQFNKAKLANTSESGQDCFDIELNYFCAPSFNYTRKISLSELPTTNKLDFSFQTQGLTVGSLIWLYYYERMGIFKILGALLDDYNYKGKYTISGNREDKNGNSNTYSILMDMISSMHREGICSNLHDRICTYQRVLGVTIDNQLGYDSTKNSGFMQTFNKLIDYQLEYYKTKQLAQAIQAQSITSPVQPRSSVATQTSIRDTINVLKQQFEPMQYGRNQINTFLGIGMVHATICLVNMLKTEIGIPDQYEKPEEFIPAAYDILIAKRSVTLNESNRYIIYDNCASYGYRLLTDLETIDLNQVSVIATGSSLDLWLNDIEGMVEGYKNAASAIPEGVEHIV